MTSYALFERQKGWRAENVLVISPYVEREFFVELIARLRPRNLHVLIDDGCRQAELDLVKEVVAASGGKPPKLYLRQTSAPGLVHAKLFYVRERSTSGYRRKWLVYGSGNATQPGFHGEINAEAIAKCRLVDGDHRRLIDWFEEVIVVTTGSAAVKIKPLQTARLALGSDLHLPGFMVRGGSSKSSNFDLWLQRRRLLSFYRPEPFFLAVPIVLKKELPAEDLAEKTRHAGFKMPKRRRLRYPYLEEAAALEDEESEEEGAASGHWRRRYFTWTQLGDWCSEGSYEACHPQFVRIGHEDRKRAVDALLALTDRRRVSLVLDKYIHSIEQLWSAYGEDAPDYLRGSRSGPNASFYREELRIKINRDLAWGKDKEFVNRYVRGVELAEVPRFRSDSLGWQNFALSLCRQLLLDMAKRKQTSLLSKTVLDLSEEAEEADSAAKLLQVLRGLWNRKLDKSYDQPFGQYVAQYHSYWE